MNKYLILLIAIINFIAIPLNAMIGLENSKEWKSRTFVALIAETARNKTNAQQKKDFIETQLKRYNETWGIIKDLASKPESGVRITIDFSLASADERVFFQKPAWDYTAQEVDIMRERAHRIMNSIEANKTSEEGL